MSKYNLVSLMILQHLMKVYGDHFLQSIQKFSKELELSLDGIPETQPPVPKQKTRVPNDKNLTPAKFQAWKMWQEDGLSIHEIAVSYPKSFLFGDIPSFSYVSQL